MSEVLRTTCDTKADIKDWFKQLVDERPDIIGVLEIKPNWRETCLHNYEGVATFYPELKR